MKFAKMKLFRRNVRQANTEPAIIAADALVEAVEEVETPEVQVARHFAQRERDQAQDERRREAQIASNVSFDFTLNEKGQPTSLGSNGVTFTGTGAHGVY